jgi:hypothetical protein
MSLRLERTRLLLLLWAASVASQTTYVLINDSPSAAQTTVQVLAQQIMDWPGQPIIDAAVPFALPAAAGTCSGTLSLTGAFCGMGPGGTVAAPGAVTLTLGTGGAPPASNGPTATRISWLVNGTASGLASALQAGAGCTASFTFTLSLRLTPLAPLAAGQVYWVSAHARLNSGNNASIANGFYWRALSATAASASPSVLPSSVRDWSNALARNWTQWTALSTAESALFSPTAVAAASPRLAVILSASGCTGIGVPPSTLVSIPVARSPLGSMASPRPNAPLVLSVSPLAIAVPPPVVPILSSSALFMSPGVVLDVSPQGLVLSSPAPGLESPDSAINGTSPMGVLSTTQIGLVTGGSAIVFGIVILIIILLLRRWRNMQRLRNGQVGGAEYLAIEMRKMQVQDPESGGVIPLVGEGQHDPHSVSRGSVSHSTASQSSPPQQPLASKTLTTPWLNLNDVKPIGLEGSIDGDGATTPHSNRSLGHLPDDDDDPDGGATSTGSRRRRGSVGRSGDANKRPLARSQSGTQRKKAAAVAAGADSDSD